jgi:formylglycine-generating enzyme required for sulfatase activity
MADVYVDDKLVGQTPLMLDLIIGQHEVKVVKGNLGIEPQTVTIAEGKTENLNLTLVEVKPKNKDFVETVKGLNMKLIFVEGGTFQMGATSEQGSDAESDEKPVHSVTLDSYYIAETEVTQAQWRAIMGTNPSNFSGDNRPVEKVSWDDAQEFCRKLSQLTGKTYTLPTEAQWEYAARGGKKSKGYKYSGRNSINDVAWYNDNSRSMTHSVKQKQPNELGLYDMSGNVWEWCSDWYGDYSSSNQTNPTGPSSGSFRVLRGGSWYDNAGYCRVSSRVSNDPSSRYDIMGFRLVCIP